MIYDLFPFFNELDLLELRLRELSGVVDRFVAIQAPETHAGAEKPIYLDLDAARWAPWRTQLRTTIVPRMPEAHSRWDREHLPRHYMSKVLDQADPEDLVIISDADEILDHRLVANWAGRVTETEWVGFNPPCYYYYLNLRTPKPFPCIALARASLVWTIGAQAIRDARKRPPLGPVPGGWHFSYMGGVEAIRTKLAAFAHDEFDTPFHRDPGRLADCLQRHQGFFGASRAQYDQVPLSDLPDDVQQNPWRYRHLLLPVEVL